MQGTLPGKQHTVRRVWSGQIALLAAGLLARGRKRLDSGTFLYHCALPQAIPVVVGAIALLFAPQADYGYVSFGLSFMFFGLVAAWLEPARSQRLTARV